MSEGVSKGTVAEQQPPHDEWEKFDLRFGEIRRQPYLMEALTDFVDLYSLYDRMYRFPPKNDSARDTYAEKERSMLGAIQMHELEYGDEYRASSGELERMIGDVRSNVVKSFTEGTPGGAANSVVYERITVST